MAVICHVGPGNGTPSFARTVMVLIAEPSLQTSYIVCLIIKGGTKNRESDRHSAWWAGNNES